MKYSELNEVKPSARSTNHFYKANVKEDAYKTWLGTEQCAFTQAEGNCIVTKHWTANPCPIFLIICP